MRVVVTTLVLVLSATASADRLDQAIGMLKSPAFKIRAQAALVLGQFKGKPRVVKPLIRALKDPHRAVRGAAAIALGRLGAPGSLKALDDAVMDDDIRVTQLARKAKDRIVKSFVKNRGRFKDNTYNFTIANWRSNVEIDYAAMNQLKERVMVAFLRHSNITVGVMALGKEKISPDVRLDLSGRIVGLSSKKCTLDMTLALRPGGYVVYTWKKVIGKGQTRPQAVAKAADVGAKKVLRFLGAH